MAEKELGNDEEKVLQRVRQEIEDGGLKLDYIVTGSWSLKASQEAARLLEPLASPKAKEFVNIVTDARVSNGGKFGTIPPEDTWSLTSTKGGGSAFVYYCDNEASLSLLSTPFLSQGSTLEPCNMLTSNNFVDRRRG